jgi:alpha-tubulin suppressor-like RCC1 family protein
MKKIFASGYNSAGMDKDGRMWIWGGVSRGKLGFN